MMRRDLIEEGDNPDITMERRKATFSVDKMAAFIHGGEHKLKRRREILKFVESEADFRDPIPPEFMSRQQRLENNTRKVMYFVCGTSNGLTRFHGRAEADLFANPNETWSVDN